MSSIALNLEALRQRMARVCEQTRRAPQSVELLAVSKTHPAAAVREAYAAGQRAFGENQVQEAWAKIEALADLRAGLSWHLIGPLQSNKTRLAAQAFDWVHSVDRLKIAERLSAQRPADLPPLNVCLQVKLSNEVSKSGVDPAELPTLALAVASLPRLRLRGLMTIPAPSLDPLAQRAPFAALRTLWDRLRSEGLALDTLSMGMSGDWEAAIAEGSTLVRVGTAIFGGRPTGAVSR